MLLLGVGLLTSGARGDSNAVVANPASPATQHLQVTPVPTPAAVSPAQGAPAPTPGTTPAQPGVGAPHPPAPVALRIPAIGVAQSLSTLGLNPDRTVQVPTDFQQPGWFGLGPAPGQDGSAVILGHVDSYQGPAVFFRLATLKPGDEVDITRADKTIARFIVTSIATYPKDQFPAQEVYGPRGYSALQLVTCGGTFDTTTRSYLSNVVAYTRLTSITPG
jgi:hypothetical protein